MFADLTSKLSKGMKSIGITKDDDELNVADLSPEDAECYADWGLTLAEENILLDQLRSEIEMDVKLSPDWDDDYLRRYLRARKHDILKAKAMVLSTLQWREEVGADTILETFDFHEKEKFHQHYPEGFYCTDRDGRPVYIQQPGNIDCSELWKFTTMERSITYHITQQEKYVKVIAPSASVAAGKLRYQSVVLIDMDGVGVSTLTGEVRSIMGKVMAIDQDYYPELMYKALIINAPTTFRVIWSMVKYLLDARTQNKIEVLPADYKEELFKLIPPEHLMEKYGGTNKAKLIDEPGPWKDPKIIKEVQRRNDIKHGRVPAVVEEQKENGGDVEHA